MSALSSLVLGSVLAMVHLTAHPVEVVTTMPKEPDEDAIYYVKGSGASGGKGWERKFAVLEDGPGEVGFSEGELNACAEDSIEKDKVEEAGWVPRLVAGVPNFRLAGAEIQIGMENEFYALGAQGVMVLQMKGRLERAGSGWRLAPSEAYLGGLPLHKLGGLGAALSATFMPPLPEKMPAVLARAESMTVQDGELVVRVR